jgi:hypothetical protein
VFSRGNLQRRSEKTGNSQGREIVKKKQKGKNRSGKNQLIYKIKFGLKQKTQNYIFVCVLGILDLPEHLIISIRKNNSFAKGDQNSGLSYFNIID